MYESSALSALAVLVTVRQLPRPVAFSRLPSRDAVPLGVDA